jgi:hypothetical protein
VVVLALAVAAGQMDHQLKTQDQERQAKVMLAALVIEIAEVVVAAVQGAM